MKEASKAMRRRIIEMHNGGFNWNEVFRGDGIDVGCGDDPIMLVPCIHFDKDRGDANHLAGWANGQRFDFIHASHLLEHLFNPLASLVEWVSLLKPGGHIVVCVPDFDLYEKCIWPSRFNGDHKFAFSMWRKGCGHIPLAHVPTMLGMLQGVEIPVCRLIDDRYDWRGAGNDIDQTIPPDGPECAIEFVIRKL